MLNFNTIISSVLYLSLVVSSKDAYGDRTVQGSVICPCGSTGRNVSVPEDLVPKKNPCEIYAFCESCEDGSLRCSSCFEGFTGSQCTEASMIDVDAKIHQKNEIILSRHVRGLIDNCPNLRAPELASMRCVTSSREKRCKSQCVPGYHFARTEAKEMTLTCYGRGWEPMPNFPECQSGGFCELDITDGSYNCTIDKNGKVCDIRCTNKRTRRYSCHPDTSWRPSLPDCVRQKATERNNNMMIRPVCRFPGAISNGVIVASRGDTHAVSGFFSVGTEIIYHCHPGFERFGSSVLKCESSGSWSSSVPYCSRITTTSTTTTTTTTTTRAPTTQRSRRRCRDPGFIENGFRLDSDGLPLLTTQSFLEGASVAFSCMEGFALEGLSLLRCLSSGRWSRSLPRCKRMPSVTTIPPPEEVEMAYCKDPGVIENGQRLLVPWIDPRALNVNRRPDQYPEGTRMVFQCNEGYSLQGHYLLTCHFDGAWSDQTPTCTRNFGDIRSNLKYCPDPGFVENGMRNIVYPVNERSGQGPKEADEYPPGVEIEYSCQSGYVIRGQDILTCLETGEWNSNTLPECNEGCGVSFHGDPFRITHGKKTSPKEWPWQVGIAEIWRNGPVLNCAGVLINRRTVLTAAHCLDGRNLSRTMLFFGKYNYSVENDNPDVESRRPSYFRMHPEYNPMTVDYDLAIIRFSPPLKLSESIFPVCLPTIESTRANLIPGNIGITTGWGLDQNMAFPDVLMMAPIPVVPNPVCQEAHDMQNITITPNMFCMGYEEGGMDTCSGDSGGPVVFYDQDKGQWTVEGIVSFGVGEECGAPKKYSVYTKVGNLMRWIRAFM